MYLLDGRQGCASAGDGEAGRPCSVANLPVSEPQENAALATGPPLRVWHQRRPGPVLGSPGTARPLRKLAVSTGWTWRQPTTVGCPIVRALLGRRGVWSGSTTQPARPQTSAHAELSGAYQGPHGREATEPVGANFHRQSAHGVSRMGEQRDSWLAQGIPTLFHAGRTSKCRKAKEKVAQHSTICPSRQRVSLRLVVRAIEIIYSTGLLVVRVMATRASTPSRTTVNISSRPSRSDAAALSWVLSSCAARRFASRSPVSRWGYLNGLTSLAST
jgi:hypothetical protein